MADAAEAPAAAAAAAAAAPPPAPVIVEYDAVTGVPAEFNEFLPPDCAEFKRWKAAQDGPEALAALTLKDKAGNEIEKQLPGGKVKTKAKPQVVLESHTRNKKKCVTTVMGLDSFGVKLSEAAKLFGKKFACGASVTKNAAGMGEQIDMQVCCGCGCAGTAGRVGGVRARVGRRRGAVNAPVRVTVDTSAAAVLCGIVQARLQQQCAPCPPRCSHAVPHNTPHPHPHRHPPPNAQTHHTRASLWTSWLSCCSRRTAQATA
jgi:translation initiation factor 1 (eIF-1/SUI1)